MNKFLSMGAALAFALSAGTALAQDEAEPEEMENGAETEMMEEGAAEEPATAAALARTSNDLAIRPVELEDLEVAGGEYGFSVSQTTYELEVGQAYTLKISSPGLQECNWRAPEFLENVYIRKIEVGPVEVKARTFEELEFSGNEPGEAELFFVPVRPGTFPWACRNMVQRNVMGEFVIR